jgi:hypothetical protein
MTNIDKPITSLEDARILQLMGLPLNWTVEHPKYSRDYIKHWDDLNHAHDKFMIAARGYWGGPEVGSKGKWRVVRRFNALIRATNYCVDFINQLGGNTVPPVFQCEQDKLECVLLDFIFKEYLRPFIEFWLDVINKSDAGITVTVHRTIFQHGLGLAGLSA